MGSSSPWPSCRMALTSANVGTLGSGPFLDDGHQTLDVHGKGLQKVDGPFKWAIVIGCIVSVAWSFANGRLAEAPWIGYKILIFAAIVFCSLMINKTIGPYVAGIERIAAGEINAEENAAMAASLKNVKWAVIGIWIGLVVEVVLGVTQPGG